MPSSNVADVEFNESTGVVKSPWKTKTLSVTSTVSIEHLTDFPLRRGNEEEMLPVNGRR